MQNKKDERSEMLRKYGVYSSIVFQMLFIIGISFWGGSKITEHFCLKNNLLTVGIGILGMCLALYTTLKRLEAIDKNEK